MTWWQRFFRRQQTEARLEAELRFHLEQQARDLIADGAVPAEAARQAQLRLGGLEQTRERCRAVGWTHGAEVFGQDARHAWRQLRRSPGLTLIAVLSLGLAIGANTAIFSLAEAALFPPFPVQSPGQLVGIYSSGPHGVGFASVSYPDFADLRDHHYSLSGAMAYLHSGVTWTAGTHRATQPAAVVTANYFSLLGVHAERGRTSFESRGHESSGGSRVVVSDQFWRRQLNADPGVIGRALTLNDHLFTVAGVAPPQFRGVDLAWGGVPSFWIPMDMIRVALPTGPRVNLLTMRQARLLLVMGRLEPGVSRAAAEADLAGVADQLASAYPATNAGRTFHLVSADEARMWPGWRQSVIEVLELLAVAVGLVLLIACANLANLLLARAAARQQETAMRLALGCSRARIVRQALLEAGMLALFGALAGLGLAAALLPLLSRIEISSHMHMNLALALDPRVFGFTLALAAVAALLFGLWPAVHAARSNLNEVLRAGGGRSDPGARGRPAGMRKAILVAEVGFAFVSVAGGVLFARSLMRLEHIDLGFQPRHVLAADLSFSPRHFTSVQGARRQQELLRQVRNLPGVRAASLAAFPPLDRLHRSGSLTVPGQAGSDDSAGMEIETDPVSPGYFASLSAGLLQGRGFSAGDNAEAGPVAIVNRSLAARLWPQQQAVGRLVHLQGETGNREIVGVAPDIKVHTAWDEPTPFLYLPLAQQYSPSVTLLVQTEGDPASYAARIETLAAQLAPAAAVAAPVPMSTVVHGSLAQPRLLAALLGWLAGIALVLALVGIYGLLAYGVNRRSHEIGLRMALGAQPDRVTGMIVGEGLRLAAAGVALGATAMAGLGHLVSALLRGTPPTDPLLLSLAGLVLLSTAAAASLLPARRAARLSPLTALRRE